MIQTPQVGAFSAWERTMSKHRANLDALIKREDLGIAPSSETGPGRRGGELYFNNLVEGANIFAILRKPDFQRDTCDWSADSIMELIKNQLDDDLIPAIILWKSANNEIFVIDGAHRLSALIAWVNDDYGAGAMSRRFFGDRISCAQKKAHDHTKQLVENEIGSYKLLEGFIKDKKNATKEQIKRANAIGSVAIRTQWVEGGPEKAEKAFVRINQGGSVIDETEKEIIKARDGAECIATRALLRAGTGHQYWWKFSNPGKNQVVELAKQIHDLLFLPEIEENKRAYEILPMAGNSYSRETMSTLYDLIFVANQISREAPEQVKNEPVKTVQNKTILYLQTILNLAKIMLSNEKQSLGLHPAIYCYTATGKFQPAAFFAEIQLVQNMGGTKESLQKFSKAREKFEDFLVDNKYFLNQLIHKLGSRTRGLPRISKLYLMALKCAEQGMTSDQTKETILKDADFAQLSEYASRHIPGKSGDFQSTAKAAVKLREILSTAGRCPECGARMHPFGTTVDHKIRKEDGGASDSDEGQSMHPFCNSGVKERREAKAKKKKQQTA